jgi:hypothetical protein
MLANKEAYLIRTASAPVHTCCLNVCSGIAAAKLLCSWLRCLWPNTKHCNMCCMHGMHWRSVLHGCSRMHFLLHSTVCHMALCPMEGGLQNYTCHRRCHRLSDVTRCASMAICSNGSALPVCGAFISNIVVTADIEISCTGSAARKPERLIVQPTGLAAGPWHTGTSFTFTNQMSDHGNALCSRLVVSCNCTNSNFTDTTHP